ncbi:MAG: DUF6411 family protein [Actinomycetota bacterium]|nr:DUF6411 family protein [Actinomycetota bacterium]
MKALLLILILLLVCAVLFAVGVLSPRRSRKMQRGVDRVARKGEVKGDRSAGRFGDLTQKGLKQSRNATDVSGRKGREIHDRISDT